MRDKLKLLLSQNFSLNNFSSRLLEYYELPIIETFLKNNNDYFQQTFFCDVSSGSSELFFKQLPNNPFPSLCEVFENKFLIGIFENTKLISILSIIKNYPENNYWFIGEFIVDISHRNRGIGQKIIKNIEKIAQELRINGLVLTVFGYDKEALNFWNKNNFVENNRKIYSNLPGDYGITMLKKLG